MTPIHFIMVLYILVPNLLNNSTFIRLISKTFWNRRLSMLNQLPKEITYTEKATYVRNFESG